MRRLRPVLLALAALLLLSQAGALVHGYSHLGRAPLRDAGAAHGAVLACAECSAFAPLLSPSGSAAALSVPARCLAPGPLVPSATGAACARHDAYYRSRAPPTPA